MDRFEALKITEFDHLELAVADLDKASDIFLRLGFERVATREVLERQLRSYLLAQNHAYVLLSTSTLRTDPVARFVNDHGDGVFSIGLGCEDAVTALDLAANRGAEVLESPKTYRKEFGTVQAASIRAFGDVRHTFVSRRGALFAEGFDVPAKSPRRAGGLQTLDAVGCVVEAGKLDGALTFYERVLGLRATGSPAAGAATLESPDARIRLRIAQPEGGRDAARNYLDVNHGPGVQHVALATDGIGDTVRALRRENVRFLDPITPIDYVSRMRGTPSFREDAALLATLGIRVDGDAAGYLLQAFTGQALGPMFFEIVQRKGYRGLGEANLRALFGERETLS